MSVPQARKVALQHYGYSSDAKRKPSNVQINVYRSFGTGGWEKAPDGGRSLAKERLYRLLEEHWVEQVGTLSRTARLSLPHLRHLADMAYGVSKAKEAEVQEVAANDESDPRAVEAALAALEMELTPVEGAASEKLLEPWMKHLCDESPKRYLVELSGREGRNLLLVDLEVTG